MYTEECESTQKTMTLFSSALSATGVIAILYFLYKTYRLFFPTPLLHKIPTHGTSSYKGSTLVLCISNSFIPSVGTSLSPFVAKLEAFLRMSNIPFLIDTKIPIMKSPSGKMPWIMYKGKTICDTSQIIAFLKEEFPDLVIPDGPVSRRVPVQRLVEDHLYWIQMLYRWARRDEDFSDLMDKLLRGVPGYVQLFLRKILRQQVRESIYAHGIGRMPIALIEQQAREDLDALSELLGDNEYFGGNDPELTDSIAYGALVGLLHGFPFREYSVRQHLRKKQNLVDYVERIKSKYFPHGERIPANELYKQ